MGKPPSFVQHLVALLAVAIPIASFAQNVLAIPTQERTGFATIQQAELRNDLTYISSDELQGRLSLQPGDEMAVKWIAEQFAKAGLKPPATDAAGKPSYLQPITLIEYRPDRAASTITLERGGKSTVWHAPQAFGTYKHAVDLTAQVVFAGFGITAPELGY